MVLRRRAESELDEELRYHLERDVIERVNAGQPVADARRAALRAMGAIEKSKEECRDLRRGPRAIEAIGRVGRDLRFALRLFRKHPLPIGIAIGGLALAIGVVTAAFSIINASLLRPYGMDDPTSVVHVARPGRPAWLGWPWPQFLRMREATTLAAVEAASPDRVRFSLARASGDVPNRSVLFVSGGYLPSLGGRPLLGRSLGPGDDTPGAPPSIVVSHHFWSTELLSDATLVGKTVWLNDVPATLVGVLEPSFTGPDDAYRAIWATFAAYAEVTGAPAVSDAAGPSVEVVARLLPDVSLGSAQQNLTTIVNQTDGARATSPGARATQQVRLYSAASPFSGFVDSETYVGLLCVVGIVGLVLALACANAANLLMASAVTRMREVGVRLAMGATRGRLVVQMTSESLLLGLMAGGFGFLLAFWLVPIFGRLVEIPPHVDLAPDTRVLLFTSAVALVCGLGTGLVPARHGTRGNLLAALQAQGTARGGRFMPSRLRASYIGFQAAVSVLLLVCAALLARTAVFHSSAAIGFDADRLVGVSLDAPRSDFDEPSYVRTALAAVQAIPSVERVSVSQYQPFGPSNERARITHNGRSFVLNVMRSDPELFPTTGLRVERGRAFALDELGNDAPVALISESVAHTFFESRDPIGQSLIEVPAEGGRRQAPARIIGIVSNALLHRIDGQDYGTVYRPLDMQRSNPPSLLVRTATPGSTARAIEDTLRGLDPRVRATTQIVNERLGTYLGATERLAWLLAPGAILALVLATLGIFGVTTFVVGQRMEEVSVRVALGASPSDVYRLFIADGLRPVTIGLVVGLALALGFSRVMESQVAGISPHDPVSIAIALSALLTCALVAVTVPARRAARANPAAALRQP